MPDRRVDAVFSALADPTRRAVLRAVAQTGHVTATQLSAQFPVSRQAVPKHLVALSDAGLLRTSRQGRELFYELTAAPWASVDWITGVGADWDDRLKSLSQYLARKAKSTAPPCEEIHRGSGEGAGREPYDLLVVGGWLGGASRARLESRLRGRSERVCSWPPRTSPLLPVLPEAVQEPSTAPTR